MDNALVLTASRQLRRWQQAFPLLPILYLFVMLFPVESSYAQNGLRLSLPIVQSPQGQVTFLKSYSKQSGLRIEIEKKGFDQNGYAFFEIGIQAKVAATKDREILIRVKLHRNSNEENHVAISKKVVLDSGQQKMTTRLLVPQLFDDNKGALVFSFAAEVDGKLDNQLLQVQSTWRTRSVVNGNIFDSDGIQAIVPFAFSQTSLNRNNFQQRPQTREGQKQFFKDNLLRYQLKQDLTKNWITYSSADVVKVESNKIEMAIKNQPTEWQSLMDWVAAGGNLWIEEVGDEASSLEEITEQLNLSDWHFDLAEGVDIRKPPVAGWKYDSLIVKSANNPAEATNEILDIASAKGLQETLKSLAQNPDTAGWYAWYPYGMGRIYAFTGRVEDFPVGLSRDQRRSAFTKLRSQNWRTRHGLVLGEKCPTFANLLIPGVGIAPVAEFQVLITLFVLLIGPINYWLLLRLNRLHLLVLTTPLFAALITASLLVYALICDGFGVQVRARTVTLLNQEVGQAVTWSRMTHYAGSAPKEGLQMPEDTTIYPILPGYESAIAGANSKDKAIVWEGKSQNLISGWLPNRTAVQHLAVRNGKSNHRIDFLTTSNRELEISNQLGVDIEWLLVKSEDNNWKFGYEIGAGDKKTLEPIELNKATVDFRILAIENKPAMPDGAGKQAGEMLENFGTRTKSRDFGSANMDGNLLNRYIERLSGIDGSRGLALPLKSYVAVTRSAVEAPLGITDIEESGSFHVTVGKW